jgi:hypothetical protein
MWWFKRAVLVPAPPDVQLMHPWFMDYDILEPGIKDLVWALNQTDLVETLSSCEGHPDSREWWDSGGAAHVLYRVNRPTRWKRVLQRVLSQSQDWHDVELVLEGRREQWLRFRVQPGFPDKARQALDKAIGQTTSLIKEYLDYEAVSVGFVRQGSPRLRDAKGVNS